MNMITTGKRPSKRVGFKVAKTPRQRSDWPDSAKSFELESSLRSREYGKDMYEVAY